MSAPENKTKRSRSENFCREDEELLLRLVDERTIIVENKKQDAVCTQQKNATWLEICEEFNSSAKVTHDVHTLRKKYGKIKMELRKRMADDRKEIFLTGGGVAKRSKPLIPEGLINLEAALALSIDGLEPKPYENESTPGVNRSKSSATVTSLDDDETIMGDQNDMIWLNANPNNTILATGDDAQPTEKSPSPMPLTSPITLHTSAPMVEKIVPAATNINPMSLRRPISKALRFSEKIGKRASRNEEAAEVRLQILQLDLQIVQAKLKQQNDEHTRRMELIALELECAKLARDRAEQLKLNDAQAHAIRMEVLKAELASKNVQ